MVFRMLVIGILVAGHVGSSVTYGSESQSKSAPPATERPDPDPARLDRQMDELQVEIDDVRRRLEGSPEQEELAPSLDLAEQVLILTRRMLAAGNGGRREPRQLLVLLDQAQVRLQTLESRLSDSPDHAMLREQLELSRQRLAHARQQFTSQSDAGSRGRTGRIDPEAIYDRAQGQLDDARARARTLPNAEELMRRLDAAQERLDAAYERLHSDAERLRQGVE